MTTLVVDASIVVKMGDRGANILWMKVRRDELSEDEAVLAARLLQAADIELLPTRSLLEAATRIAIELDHPAYDCLYLALATENGCQFVTADTRLLRKLDRRRPRALRGRAISLTKAAGPPHRRATDQ